MEPAPPVPPTPPAPPMPPAPPVPPAPPAPPPGDPTRYAAGGFLGQFNWVEVGILILGCTTLFVIIDYYRKKSKSDKENQVTISDLSQKVDTVQKNFDGLVTRLRRPR